MVVEVADSGPGIPPEEAENVFEKFYRGPSLARTTKGTGLGLYLVKELAETLGASVGLVGPEGGEGASLRGARFRMTFDPVRGD